MKRLPVIQCPSLEDDMVFKHENCTQKACALWDDGRCTAADDTQEAYAALLDRFPDPGACPLAERCRWHLQAVEQGDSKCLVRRLGELCEHQGGEWNTFEMAPPDEWVLPGVET